MGKLIVFEGTDGSGKSTQFAMLTKRLKQEHVDFRKLQFPQYLEPSSALIRMYLNGEFGDKPTDVNPYAASTFYAVDRYASYQKVWRSYYQQGGVMLSDRYTTSNAVHQGGKVTGAARQACLYATGSQRDKQRRKVGEAIAQIAALQRKHRARQSIHGFTSSFQLDVSFIV